MMKITKELAPKSLQSVFILRNVTESARLKLERQCTWRNISEKNSIIDYQDSTNDVYFLITGRARVIIYSASGKAVAFRDLGPGDVFGEFAAIDGLLRSASVEAIDSCFLAIIRAADFRDVLTREPGITVAMLEHAIAQIRSLTERIYEFSTLAVNNRIQAELLRLAQQGQIQAGVTKLTPAPTHLEIASRISTHREGVSRELSRLARLGLIERQGPALVIKDMKRLARMVHEAADE
jgi:CRP-like cAMP-binding protein